MKKFKSPRNLEKSSSVPTFKLPIKADKIVKQFYESKDMKEAKECTFKP